MRIVVDVGCATWGGDQSVPALIEEFDPDVLYGFDPGSGIDAIVPPPERPRMYLMKGAAWTHDGSVRFREANLGGQVDPHGEMVKSYDLARFILELEDAEVILKIDAEGAEYELLPHLIEHDADLRLSVCLVEWHCDKCGYGIWNKTHPVPCDGDHEMWVRRRNELEAGMRCEMREWTL